MKLLIIVLMIVLAGCDFRPTKTFSLRTESGETILLHCPTVDSNSTAVVHFVNQQCVVEIPKNPQK